MEELKNGHQRPSAPTAKKPHKPSAVFFFPRSGGRLRPARVDVPLRKTRRAREIRGLRKEKTTMIFQVKKGGYLLKKILKTFRC